MNPGTPPEQPHDTSSAKPSWRAQPSCPSRSEQAMRLAILAGRIGTWDWEFATGQIIWSEMHEQLWGMAPGSFQGTYSEFAARVHPDDRPGLEAAVRHAIGELIPYDHEYRVIWPDGTVLWIAGHGEVFCDEEGRPVRMMGIVRDITDRKVAEEELRKTKTNLELAQAHAHLGSWELNVTTGTGTWSQEMFHLFDHETARGAPAFGEFIEMIHPEDRPTLLEKHDLAARTNEEISLEFRTNPARGAVKHLNATFYASHDSHGRMTQLSGTVLDVTRYKKIEAALRESEERYRDVLENAHDLIQSVAPDGRFLFVNRAWREMLGYSAEEVARLNLFDIIPARAQAHCRALFAQALSGDSPGPVEAIFITKGGCEILVEGSLSRKIESGKVTALRCIFRDVTRRKRTEEALRASEEKFRQLAENIREVFWMTDVAKNEMIYVSPGYETIWGRSCASLYESPRSWLDSIYSEDRSRVLNAATSQQVSGRYDVEYRIVRADGSMRWIHDKAFPVRNESGEVYRIVGIAEDITELKQAEAELQRSEKHFRSLIENAQDLITLVDAQGVIRFQSPSSLPLMGYAPAQLRDRNAFALIHP
ncbi:MAG: PAS domain S-box protein, partial [Verrucomicrobiota bacterium]